MYIDRSRHQRFDTAADEVSGSAAGGESAPSRIVMHHAIDEDGCTVRVASIVPRYKGPGTEVVEGLPQWFTEHGERMALLCDSWFQVVGTHQKVRIIKSSRPHLRPLAAA